MWLSFEIGVNQRSSYSGYISKACSTGHTEDNTVIVMILNIIIMRPHEPVELVVEEDSAQIVL